MAYTATEVDVLVNDYVKQLKFMARGLNMLVKYMESSNNHDDNKSRKKAEKLYIDWMKDMSAWVDDASRWFFKKWFISNKKPDEKLLKKLLKDMDKVDDAMGSLQDELTGTIVETSSYLNQMVEAVDLCYQLGNVVANDVVEIGDKLYDTFEEAVQRGSHKHTGRPIMIQQGGEYGPVI